MKITYTYEIYELKQADTLGDLTKVITEIVYTYKGTTEEGVTSMYPGRVKLPAPDSELFIPTENLTEANIIAWIEGNTNLDVMKEAIEKHIEQQSGVILKGNKLPWLANQEPIEAPVSPEETMDNTNEEVVETVTETTEETIVEETVSAVNQESTENI